MVSRYGDARSVVGGLRMGATIPNPIPPTTAYRTSRGVQINGRCKNRHFWATAMNGGGVINA